MHSYTSAKARSQGAHNGCHGNTGGTVAMVTTFANDSTGTLIIDYIKVSTLCVKIMRLVRLG